MYIIPVGTTASELNEKAVITGNGLGQYFAQSEEELVQKVADYIFNRIKTTLVENAKTYAEENVDDTTGLLDFVFTGDSMFTASNTQVTNLLSNFDLTDYILNKDNVAIKLSIIGLNIEDVPTSDWASIQSYLNMINAAYSVQNLDINIKEYINENDPVSITSTENAVTITIPIPEALQGLTNYRIIRIHNGVQTVIEPIVDLVNNTLTFSTNLFSTYSVVGSDASLPSILVTPSSGPAPEPSGNQAPTAKNFVFDTPTTVSYSGKVYGTDPDGDAVWYQLLGTGATSGYLSFNTDGSFVYLADSSVSGPAYFSYQICDSWKCSPAYEVTLTNGGGVPATGVEDFISWQWTLVLLMSGAGALFVSKKLNPNS